MLNGKKIIALCLSKVNDEVTHDYIMGLNDSLKKESRSLFVYATYADMYWNTPEDRGEATVFSLINYDITDAVVVLDEKIKSNEIVNSIAKRCDGNNIPLIFAGGMKKGRYSIGFDYDEGFARVVRHVIDDHGITDLHMIAGFKGNDFSDNRIAVFRRVLEEHGMAFSDDMVSYGDFWSVPTEEAVKKLIRENRLPRAFICANDVMAIAVCGILAENNIRVPDDIIVTGFDGIEAIRFSVPKIASCMCSYVDLAVRTAEMLDDIFERGNSGEHVSVTPRLLPSESCGCRCKDNINISLYLNDVNNRFFRFQEESYALSKISVKVQMCESIEEVAQKFNMAQYFYNMICVLKPECADESVSPLSGCTPDFTDSRLLQLFNTDHENAFEPAFFDSAEIFPGIKSIMEKNVPLIFFSLNYIENPMGYVCFHFNNYDPANYAKMPQIVYYMNSALGSYRNIRCHHYLNSRIEEMYKSDALTGLYNRSGFIKEYNKMIQDAENGVTVILADLDGLKSINDGYGHGEGDIAIHEVALALRECCPDSAICARFGGDEMLAVIKGSYTEDIRSRINRYLECFNRSSGKPYTVSASVGIYHAAYDEIGDFEEILRHSDKLMYMDKENKKCRSR